MQRNGQVKQFNPANFSGMAGGRLLAGLAILAVALTVSGCTHTHARTTRTVVVTPAYHGPYVGVQRVYATGLYITIILVGGHTVYLPDDIYHHPDGYRIIISGGRVIALDGIPPGLLIASTRPGARRGRPFRGGRVAITSILFEGGRIIFVDGYGARISLPGGHYQGKHGHRLDFGDGHLRQVALNPAAPQQTKRPPKPRRADKDRDRPDRRRRGETSRRDERPERRDTGSSDRRSDKPKNDASSNGRGNSSADRGSSGRGNSGSSNSAGKKTDQPSGNKGVGKKEAKPAGKSDAKKGGKSAKGKDDKKKDDKKKDEKKKPAEDDDSPPR